MPVGDAIRRLRLSRGWSQADLARRSDVSQPTVQRIEAGAPHPSVVNVVRIARALGVSVEDLMDELVSTALADRLEDHELRIIALEAKPRR